MWGNRLGWMISGGIVVVTIGIYAMVILGAGISPPTTLTTKPGAMDAMEFPGNPRSLVAVGSGGDATALYREAVSAYRSNPDQYKEFEMRGKSADIAKLSGIASIVKASQAGPGKIFTSDPESIIRHGGKRYEALKVIESPGRATMRAGQLNVAKNPKEATKYFEAVFNLGYALYSERITYPEFMLGQEFMRVAALELAKLDKSKASQLNGFSEEGQVYVTSLPFPMLFNPSNRNVVDRNAGDVFNLAQHSSERMWKIEAILMLGHYKYFATHAGDQRGANKVLAQMAADDTLDPAVKAAVKASQELTLADHNTSAQMK